MPAEAVEPKGVEVIQRHCGSGFDIDRYRIQIASRSRIALKKALRVRVSTLRPGAGTTRKSGGSASSGLIVLLAMECRWAR